MNGKSLYLKIILTVIALLLALLVFEQRYIVRGDWVFNRITGEATPLLDHHTPRDYFSEEIDTSSGS